MTTVAHRLAVFLLLLLLVHIHATMKVGTTIISNFTLMDEAPVPEIHAIGRIFIHKQSGARLTHFETSDDNKVFAAAFRTPPTDSTGVPHILEHSVLCGSRRYPTREPFVELAKGSLQTFLNAFTYNDKTVYPVASQNDKDFENLMRVYLDAVLFPNIYENPQTFEQEGWHYHLEDVAADLDIKGVVHSEMKGVYSNPESVLERKMTQYLYPETPYTHDSGGEPEAIPDLTHAAFTAFHSKNYHPSNAYLYLYGNGDLKRHLELVDEFLSGFEVVATEAELEPIDPNAAPKRLMKVMRPPGSLDMLMRQAPFSVAPNPYTVEYPISPAESVEGKAYTSLHWAVGDCTDPFLYLAFDILEYLLLETPAAPLKKALLKANIGEDVYGSFDTTFAQPSFTVVLKNSDQKHAEEFRRTVLDTLQDIARSGIDKKLVEAAINHAEFQLREADFRSYPKGLIYILTSLESWLHDADPFMHLKFEDTVARVREGALSGTLFEELIKKYLVDNTHRISIELIPKSGLEEDRAKEVAKELAAYKAGLSEAEVTALVRKTKDLLARQAKEDSPEALATIPLLDLSEVSTQEHNLSVADSEFVYPRLSQVTEKGEMIVMSAANASAFLAMPILHHPAVTNGIIYGQFIFDMTDALPLEQMSYMPLLAHCLGRIGTAHRTYSDLSMETDIRLGGFKASVSSMSLHGSDQLFRPILTIDAKFLVRNARPAMELLGEIVSDTVFDDQQRLRELVNEVKSRAEMRIHGRGHAVASRRAASYLSPHGQYLEMMEGLTSYHFIRDLAKDFASKCTETAALLQTMLRSVTSLERMLVGVTSTKAPEGSEDGTVSDDQAAFIQSLPVLCGALDRVDRPSIPLSPDDAGLWGTLGMKNRLPTRSPFPMKGAANRNEGLMSSSKVQYVAKSGMIADGTAAPFSDYHGSMDVASHLGSLDYLWNRLRVQGGAYGCWLQFTQTGRVVFLSYRDPNFVKTLQIYDEAADYFKKYEASEREVTKNILGTIASRDAPLTPSMRGTTAVRRYLCGLSDDVRQRVRNEILGCSVDDIRSIGNVVSKALKSSVVCAFGNEALLTKCKDDGGLEHLLHVFE